jgi:hypothetical protein
MDRNILTIIVQDSVERPQFACVPKTMTLIELVNLLMDPRVSGSDEPAHFKTEEVMFFDWSNHQLPIDAHVGEIPLPGILIAVIPTDKSIHRSPEINLWLAHQALIRDEVSYDRLSRYLSSPDAVAVPLPIKEIDVFISYSFEDGFLAAEILHSLEARGLRVFIAESSLIAGQQWRDQLRKAIRSSRSALFLLTRSSAHSAWVLAEAGALASQGTPGIGLFEGIEMQEIPLPLRDAFPMEPATQPERWLRVLADYINAEGLAADEHR